MKYFIRAWNWENFVCVCIVNSAPAASKLSTFVTSNKKIQLFADTEHGSQLLSTVI